MRSCSGVTAKRCGEKNVTARSYGEKDVITGRCGCTSGIARRCVAERCGGLMALLGDVVGKVA